MINVAMDQHGLVMDLPTKISLRPIISLSTRPLQYPTFVKRMVVVGCGKGRRSVVVECGVSQTWKHACVIPGLYEI